MIFHAPAFLGRIDLLGGSLIRIIRLRVSAEIFSRNYLKLAMTFSPTTVAGFGCCPIIVTLRPSTPLPQTPN
jgi:hypothetical protein